MQSKPPQLAQRFLLRFLREDLKEEVLGDLEEKFYDKLEESSAFRARLQYWYQVLHYLRPFAIRKAGLYTHPNHYAMYSSYFIIGWRNLAKHKVYSLINILGLAVGMGVCLLIYQYIHFELSYDQFHENAERTYRLTQTSLRHGENLGVRAYTTYGLGPEGKESLPDIKSFARVHHFDGGLIFINEEQDERHQENNTWYVDSTFLQLFDFPLKYGDRATVLDDQYSIVLTDPMATRYFGSTNPVGKTLRVSGGVLTGDFVVTGVLKPLPENTHLQFDFLMPISFFLEHWGPVKNHDDGWNWQIFVTYITLNEPARQEDVREKLDQLITSRIDKEQTSNNEAWQIGLQPLMNIHLYSSFPEDLAKNNGDIQNVRFFGIIALFILLIAWVNYINLSTARAMHRAKEVGVRKSVGAYRRQLITQFLTESALINTLAAALSVGMAVLALPLLNHIIGKELSLTILQNLEFWGGFALVILVGTLFSGLYPAFILSAIKPVTVLKAVRLSTAKGFSLRRSLIVFQFVVSVLLISGTYLVYRQITYMKNQNLGYEMEKILVVNGPRVILETQRPALESLFQTFKTKLLQHPSITSVCGTSQIPSLGYMGTWNVLKAGAPESTTREGKVIFTDTSFFNTYDLEFLAQREMPTEYDNYEWVVINKEAVKAFGLGSSEEAINERLQVFDGTLGILGVVKDINWSSLKEAQVPMLFTLDKYYGAYFSIKINMTDIRQSITHIEEAYHSVYPDDPFHYFFLDDTFNQQYQADLQFGNLFSAFSLLAIFVACIGLFALVSYSATLRIKEIGIRKVLGAGVGHLMMLLSREYLVLLFIALVLAIPAVFFGGKLWLENYAYQVGISIDLFLIPGLVLLLIALLTVSYQTIKAASVNPVKSLRSE